MKLIALGVLLLLAALSLILATLMPTAPDAIVPPGLPAAPAAPVNAAGSGTVAAPAAPVNAAGSGTVAAPSTPGATQAGGLPAAPTSPGNAAGSGTVVVSGDPVPVQAPGTAGGAEGTAMQVTITGTVSPAAAANGIQLRPAGVLGGRPAFSLDGSTSMSGVPDAVLLWDDYLLQWQYYFTDGGSFAIWTSADDVLTPDLVSTWSPQTEGSVATGSPIMTWVRGVYATAVIDPAGGDNNIAVQALGIGSTGNLISVEITAPSVLAFPSIAVNGYAITATPGAKGLMTVAGTGPHTDGFGDPETINGLKFYAKELENGKPSYWPFPALQGNIILGSYSVIRWTGTQWEFKTGFQTGGYYFRAYSAENVATPDLVTAWTVDTSGNYALSTGTVDGMTAGVSSAQAVIDALNATPAVRQLVLTYADGLAKSPVAATGPVFLTGGLTGGSITAPDAIQPGGLPPAPAAPTTVQD